MTRISALVAIAAVAGLAGSAAATDPLPRVAPGAAGLSPSKLNEATTLLRGEVEARKIAGAVAAVARHGKLVYLEAVGVQDVASRAPMTDRSLFRIYSMTKSVTAVAVLMLADEGRFSLSDPASRYLPELKNVRVAAPGGPTRPPAREITVEDLLLHTSGFNHRTSEEYRAAQVRSRSIGLPQFVANLVRVPLMEDPGTRFRYSESTTVLGRLVEIWSGRPFEAFLDERILKPLGMVDTSFWVRSEQRAQLTTVYAPAESGLRPIEIEEVPFTERPALIEGAVGLVSTVPDYLRFSQMLLNKGELDGVRLLRAATVERMVANGLSEPVLRARGGDMGWGTANVNVVLDPAAVPYPASRGEYGWDGSAGTIFWIDPGKQLITILMTQSVPANPDGIRQRFKTLIEQSLQN
jgi:CubicO group peptidase (beta-lactamase class C family)